jgi:hypothetical protein
MRGGAVRIDLATSLLSFRLTKTYAIATPGAASLRKFVIPTGISAAPAIVNGGHRMTNQNAMRSASFCRSCGNARGPLPVAP